jgi:hypothetical protein
MQRHPYPTAFYPTVKEFITDSCATVGDAGMSPGKGVSAPLPGGSHQPFAPRTRRKVVVKWQKQQNESGILLERPSAIPAKTMLVRVSQATLSKNGSVAPSAANYNITTNQPPATGALLFLPTCIRSLASNFDAFSLGKDSCSRLAALQSSGPSVRWMPL